jgi:hypothetical protein
LRAASLAQVLTYNLNTDKPTLFPILRLHPSPLQDRVRTRNPDPLRRRRTPQTQHAFLAKMLPRRLQRITDGEEYRTTHEQRRLADTARSLNSAQVLPCHVFEQRDIEHLGNVAETGDLVSAGTFGEDTALLLWSAKVP